jgi:hypothetical protein
MNALRSGCPINLTGSLRARLCLFHPRADGVRVPPGQRTGLREFRESGGAFDHEFIQHPWLSTPLLADLL